jgi:hypothetical protein
MPVGWVVVLGCCTPCTTLDGAPNDLCLGPDGGVSARVTGDDRFTGLACGVFADAGTLFFTVVGSACPLSAQQGSRPGLAPCNLSSLPAGTYATNVGTSVALPLSDEVGLPLCQP